MATSTETTEKKGSLTIAGTGIASIKHITLETLSYIKEAEKVYYLVADPATEAFIQDNASGTCFNLHVFYDTNKHRYDSYVQMAEVMLLDVRAGHSVLGIFYGHPGVFVSPSHRAIAIAREEGFKAHMLPGISAEDYMFADIGFDPATHGCVSYEATELLVRDKPLLPSSHNIIWQVGAIGANAMVFDNGKFNILVDRLEQVFGPDHKVVHYIGAVLPQSTSTIEAYTISDLRKGDVVEKFSTTSTLYVPPSVEARLSGIMVRELGLEDSGFHTKSSQSRTLWAGPVTSSAPAYGPQERIVIAQIDKDVIPDSHQILQASDAMKKTMANLALNPKLSEEYYASPSTVVEKVTGLSEQEKKALILCSAGAIHMVMAATQTNIAQGHQWSAEELEAAGTPHPALALLVVIICLI
ncbi:tetrapyrrole methylase [Fomitiporia mediterranea MF3/22]|uniref:tetrapyrrole methylase n=1 Tax=Fomitiporia mediterranea (strain MF3/22) TaxID=694068 RepID=UPI0004408717|nr:tetrapyrrole methylase [Fomitiporia mediterranea MF3/22]EJD06538.1 tetrapyrrole methylase [Fomitiporia mediterranea MF3/22]